MRARGAFELHLGGLSRRITNYCQTLRIGNNARIVVDAEEKQRFERAVERELVAGQRREPLWSDILHDAEGDEKAAKRAYVKIRVEQLVEGELDRRQKRRRKRKKRGYQDRNALSLQTGRRIVYSVMALGVVVVFFLLLLLSHGEKDRWIVISDGAGSPVPDEFDPSK